MGLIFSESLLGMEFSFMRFRSSRPALLVLALCTFFCGCTVEEEGQSVAGANSGAGGEDPAKSAEASQPAAGSSQVTQQPLGQQPSQLQHLAGNSPEPFRTAEQPASGEAPPMPVASTPTEELFVKLIQGLEARIEDFKKIQDVASAKSSVGRIRDHLLEEQRLWREVIKTLGIDGMKKFSGAPAGFQQRYSWAKAQENLAEKQLESNPQYDQILPVLRSELDDVLQQSRQMQIDPSEGLAAGQGEALVKLVNNQAIQGPRHQRLIAHIKQAAGASDSRSVIGKDGSYTVHLIGVSDFDALVRTLDAGAVSNVDRQTRTLTLTVDPTKFPELASDTSGRPEMPAAPVPPQESEGISAEREAYVTTQLAEMRKQHPGKNIVELRFLGSMNADLAIKISEETFRKLTPVGLVNIPLGKGGCSLLLAVSGDYKEFGTKLDLGEVQSVDEDTPRITIKLDLSKLP